MVETAELSAEAQTKLKNHLVIGGTLRELLDTKGLAGLDKASNVEFHHEGTFQSYSEIGTDKMFNVGNGDIDIVKITTPDGQEHCYECIARQDDTADDLTNGKDDNGAKLMAWVEIKSESGPDGSKPVLGQDGKGVPVSDNPAVIIATPGYADNPLAGDYKFKQAAVTTGFGLGTNKEMPALDNEAVSGQTKSMFLVGADQVHRSVEDVPAFIDTVKAKLAERGVDNPAYECHGHSMGCAPAIAAAALLDAPVTLLEPTAATLTTRKLREAFVGSEGASDEEKEFAKHSGLSADEFNARLDKVIANTTSVRNYTIDENGEKQFSRAAYLKTTDGTNTDQVRTENIRHMVMGSSANVKGDYTQIDPDNEMVGRVVHMEAVNIPNHSITLAGKFDLTHPDVNTVGMIYQNDNVKMSLVREAERVAKEPVLAMSAANETLAETIANTAHTTNPPAAAETIEKSGANRDTSLDAKMIQDLQVALNAGPDKEGNLSEKYFAARKHFLGSSVEAGESDAFKAAYEKHAVKTTADGQPMANTTAVQAQNTWTKYEQQADQALASVTEDKVTDVMKQYGAQLNTDMDERVDGEHSATFNGLDKSVQQAISAAASGIVGKVQLKQADEVAPPSVPQAAGQANARQ